MKKLGSFSFPGATVNEKNITHKQKMLCPRMTDIMIDHF
jgi:hypothetical protein